MNQNPHGSSLRKGRFSEVNITYLVTTVTNKRIRHFENFESSRLFINTIRNSDNSNKTKTLSWVIMPDHIHWLFDLLEEQKLEEVVRSVKGTFARYFNQKHNLTGNRFWQAGFHDRAIRREEDMIVAARYIVANPLRAGLVNDIGNYPHWDSIWL